MVFSNVRLERFPLLTRDEIENSPSRRDGVSWEQESKHQRMAAKKIFDTGIAFKLSVSTPSFATMLFLRFFSRKSMRHNSTFVVAAASLFLAGKINDDARPHAAIAAEMLKQWYGRDLARSRLLGDAAFTQRLCDAVLQAECALLVAVGFDFELDLALNHVVRLLHAPRFEALLRHQRFQQLAVSLCNDILTNDGTLMLQFPAHDVGVGIFYFLIKILRATGGESVTPAPEPGGGAWYLAEGVAHERCVEIAERFTQRVYKKSDEASVGGGTSSAAGVASSLAGASQPSASYVSVTRPGSAAEAGREQVARPGMSSPDSGELVPEGANGRAEGLVPKFREEEVSALSSADRHSVSRAGGGKRTGEWGAREGGDKRRAVGGGWEDDEPVGEEVWDAGEEGSLPAPRPAEESEKEEGELEEGEIC